MRTALNNVVVAKPGNHELHFKLYKLTEEFKCRLNLKIPETFISSVFVVGSAIQKWNFSN